MTYTIPGIPPSNNEYIGRTNYREYQRAKKMWAERIALCCRPKPWNPLPRARVVLTYYFNHIELILRCGLDKADPHVEIEVTPC